MPGLARLIACEAERVARCFTTAASRNRGLSCPLRSFLLRFAVLLPARDGGRLAAAPGGHALVAQLLAAEGAVVEQFST